MKRRRVKKLLIILNQSLRQPDIEEMRKDVARQLKEGLVIVDARVKEVILLDECHEAKIEAVNK